MTNIQKKAYRYDALSELDQRLSYKMDEIKEQQEKYENEMKECSKEDWESSWHSDEYTLNNSRLEVLKELRKDLEKL